LVTVDFTGTDGGTAPITSYTVTATDYGPGGTQHASDGSSPITVRGLTNGVPYAVTVTATNRYGNSPPSAPGTITIGVPPKFVSGPAANGIVGRPYASQFSLNGAPPPIVRLVYGSNLPPGLTLDAAGVLTGTPEEAETYTFTVKAWSPLGIPRATATITISDGVTADITGCQAQGGNA
jgi:large repetitive protein